MKKNTRKCKLFIKTIRAMKLIVLLLLAFSIQLGAKTYAQKISLSEHNTPLSVIFDKIEKQTGYTFAYTASMIEKAKPVSIERSEMTIHEVLYECFQNQPFIYDIVEKTIVIKPLPQEAQQFILVKGTVTNENGTPLPGTTIVIKGTTQGTGTNEKGEYSIKVPQGSILVFSFVGLQKREVLIDKQELEVNVVLKNEISKLEEVTVFSTGYREVTKERATGSFFKPDMEIIKSRDGSNADIIGRMEGMVPGLTVIPGPTGITANAIGNGVTGRKSIIRGENSVQLDSNPLYVIDGIQVPYFDIINSEDIEDITVLKDAAAAAIWGTKAANGIIVVTTKKGKRNSKIQVEYKSYFNFLGKPDFSHDPMLSSEEYIQTAKEIFDPVNYSWSSVKTESVAPHEQILFDQYRGIITEAQANTKLDSLADISNLDQIKNLFYRNAYSMGHTISVSGGGDKYSFFSSMSYTDVKDNQLGTKNNTYRIALNQDLKFNENIRFSLNATIANNVSSRKNYPSVSNRFFPYQLFRDENGNDINIPYMFGWREDTRLQYQEAGGINLDYYPLKEINYSHGEVNNRTINLTGNMDVKLCKGLSFKGTYGYITALGSATNYIDYKTLNQRKLILSLTTPGATPTYIFPENSTTPPVGGTYATSDIETRNWTIRNQLAYTTSFRKGKDQLDIQIGQEASESFLINRTNIVEGYDEQLQTYALMNYEVLNQDNYVYPTVTGFGAYQQEPFSISEDRDRFMSLFALASYMIDRKYGIDLSWRRDHSNLFGQDKSTQNKPTWSVGAKWITDREDFMKGIDWINGLALRTTYGITGQAPPSGSSASQDILGASYSTLATGASYYIATIANPKLAWESTRNLNIGVDFAVLNNRISGSLNLYWKNTTNLLGSLSPNSFVGAGGGVLQNIGNTTNKGIELSLTTLNVQTKDFSWATSFVFSHNRNKLVSYIPTDAYYNTPSGRISAFYLIGHALNPLFAYRYAGLNEEGNPMIEHPDGSTTVHRDSAMIEDVTYMGSTTPVVSGGLTNTFTYKGFTLTANMIYNFGHVMRKNINTFYSGRLTGSGLSSGNISTSFLNRWKEAGDEEVTDIPRYYSNSIDEYLSSRNIAYYLYADKNVVSASYIKLRDITLSYHLPDKLVRSLKLQAVSLSAQIGDFMLWRANDLGIDPEYQDLKNGGGYTPNKHPVNFSMSIKF